MNMMKRTFVAMVAILATASVVMAQGGGGGGRGQGGGRMMMGGGGQSQLQLLSRNDVKKDLKLNDEQSSKIQALQDEQRAQMQQMMEEMRNGGQRPDQETMRKMFEESTKKQNEAIAKILTPAQIARLKQIRVQLSGSRIIMDAEIQKELGITADQKTKIEGLQAKQRDANAAIMEKVQNQELSREEATAAREKNNKILEEEIAKVLTDAQKAKLKEMAGPKFEAEPQERRGP